MHDPKERTVEHLMMLYYTCKLELNGTDSIFSRLCEKGSDKLLGHAMSFAGRNLKSSTGTVRIETIEKLRKLWAHRMIVLRSSPSAHVAEAIAFGWWFVSAKFEDRWSVAQLAEVLRLVGRVEVEWLVVKRLAELATEMPKETTECLELMVQQQDDPWRVFHWRDDARVILTTALSSGNADACKVAANVINRLCAQGHLEFKGLLDITRNL